VIVLGTKEEPKLFSLKSALVPGTQPFFELDGFGFFFVFWFFLFPVPGFGTQPRKKKSYRCIKLVALFI